ncbi:MAG: hypothetical protein ACJ8LM_00745, partial [Candidatus Udaeobacter sp.]
SQPLVIEPPIRRKARRRRDNLILSVEFALSIFAYLTVGRVDPHDKGSALPNDTRFLRVNNFSIT